MKLLTTTCPAVTLAAERGCWMFLFFIPPPPPPPSPLFLSVLITCRRRLVLFYKMLRCCSQLKESHK